MNSLNLGMGDEDFASVLGWETKSLHQSGDGRPRIFFNLRWETKTFLQQRIRTIHQTSMVPPSLSPFSGNWVIPFSIINASWRSLMIRIESDWTETNQSESLSEYIMTFKVTLSQLLHRTLFPTMCSKIIIVHMNTIFLQNLNQTQQRDIMKENARCTSPKADVQYYIERQISCHWI